MSHTPCPISVRVEDRPERMVILKRGKQAAHYYAYCEEVGCEVWTVLCGIKSALFEPVGMWLPESMRPEGTSLYVQGVEVPENYAGPVPEGFETLVLPCRLLLFQSPPYEDKDFEEAFHAVQQLMASYNPEQLGHLWDDAVAPRIQLEPKGIRGYIEGRPIRPINA